MLYSWGFENTMIFLATLLIALLVLDIYSLIKTFTSKPSEKKTTNFQGLNKFLERLFTKKKKGGKKKPAKGGSASGGKKESFLSRSIFLLIPFKFLWGFRLPIINVALLTYIALTTVFIFTKAPWISDKYPEEYSVWKDYSKPIEITFDVPINPDRLTPNISPDIKGEWVYQESFSFLPLTRKIKFYPEQSIFPDTPVLVYVAGIANHLDTTNPWESLIEFDSPTLPEVILTAPKNNAENIGVEPEIDIILSSDDGEFMDWNIQFEPEVKFQLERQFGNKLVIRPIEKLSQDTKYSVKVTQVPVSYSVRTGEVIERKAGNIISDSSFTTIPAPSVEAFEPKGTGVLAATDIRVTFDNEVIKEEVEANFSITPEVDGVIVWEDDKTFIFIPSSPLPKETSFTVKFAQGFHNQLGGIVEQDLVFDFETIGEIKAAISPAPGSSRIKRTSNITITFDQEVDHATAQAKVSIAPSVAGVFSWSGNTLTFNPTEDLSWGQSYTISVSPVSYTHL
ncbi:MAG TPA: hypothetical protein ENI23_11795, partial [bacterium]|nr:hypothetical protein [bacterium]